MATTPRIIVPVAVLEGEIIPESLVEFLSTVPIVLLGYCAIPEQTVPEQARDEFEELASEELAALAEIFESYGATVETRLAFTHDPGRTIKQVVMDTERSAVLLPNPTQTVDQILVSVRHDVLTPAIAATVAELVDPTETTITLFYATADDETADNKESGDQLLSAMTTALENEGIPRRRISRVIERTDKPDARLIQVAREYDLLVIGEDEPQIRDRIFGERADRVAEQARVSVLVVQRPRDE